MLTAWSVGVSNKITYKWKHVISTLNGCSLEHIIGVIFFSGDGDYRSTSTLISNLVLVLLALLLQRARCEC